MFPEFLPARVRRLSEATSRDQAAAIRRLDITVPRRPRRQNNPETEPLVVPTPYVCRGSGEPPLLLLHGFDSSVLEFRRLQPLLARSQQTWAVDLWGFGFTDRPSGTDFAPSDIKAHLYAFWQAAIARPVVLVGASMGGAAAIDFALTYPDAVSRLILLDSAGIGTGPVAGKYLFPPLDYLAAEFLRRPGVRDRISYSAYFDKRFNSDDARGCAALHLESPDWHRALIAFTKSGGFPSFATQLSHIQAPTLIVWGQEDGILGTDDAETFRQAIPNSRLVWIPCCGHVPHLERPQTTARAIAAFLADLGAGDGEVTPPDVAPPDVAPDSSPN